MLRQSQLNHTAVFQQLSLAAWIQAPANICTLRYVLQLGRRNGNTECKAFRQLMICWKQTVELRTVLKPAAPSETLHLRFVIFKPKSYIQSQVQSFSIFKNVTHSDDVSSPAIVSQVMISQVLALSMAEGSRRREERWVLLCAESNLDRQKQHKRFTLYKIQIQSTQYYSSLPSQPILIYIM